MMEPRVRFLRMRPSRQAAERNVFENLENFRGGSGGLFNSSHVRNSRCRGETLTHYSRNHSAQAASREFGTATHFSRSGLISGLTGMFTYPKTSRPTRFFAIQFRVQLRPKLGLLQGILGVGSQ